MNKIKVKNFELFQHYKDRNPPWIKLHYETLDDYDFAALPDAAKWHLVAIWLLASRTQNATEADPAWIARRINATEKVDLALLQKLGFIQSIEPCSKLLAERKQSAMPETETQVETETETETEKKESVAAVAAPVKRKPEPKGTRLEVDWRPDGQSCEFARTLGLDPWTDVLPEFLDFWPAVPGARGRKLDWHSTFRNRCREVAGKGNRRGGQRNGPRRPDSLAAIGADVVEVLARKAERAERSSEDRPGDYSMPPTDGQPRERRDGSSDDGGQPVGRIGGIPVGCGPNGAERMAAIGEMVAHSVGDAGSLPLAGGAPPEMVERTGVAIPDFLRRF